MNSEQAASIPTSQQDKPRSSKTAKPLSDEEKRRQERLEKKRQKRNERARRLRDKGRLQQRFIHYSHYTRPKDEDEHETVATHINDMLQSGKRDVRTRMLKKKGTSKSGAKRKIRQIARKRNAQLKKKIATLRNEYRPGKTRGDYRADKTARLVIEGFRRACDGTFDPRRIGVDRYEKLIGMANRFLYWYATSDKNFMDKIPFEGYQRAVEYLSRPEVTKETGVTLPAISKKAQKEIFMKIASTALERDERFGQDTVTHVSKKALLPMMKNGEDTMKTMTKQFKELEDKFKYATRKQLKGMDRSLLDIIQMLLVMQGIEPNPGPFMMTYTYPFKCTKNAPSIGRLLKRVETPDMFSKVLSDLSFIPTSVTQLASMGMTVGAFMFDWFVLCEAAHKQLYRALILEVGMPLSDKITKSIARKCEIELAIHLGKNTKSDYLAVLNDEENHEIALRVKDFLAADKEVLRAEAIKAGLCCKFEEDLPAPEEFTKGVPNPSEIKPIIVKVDPPPSEKEPKEIDRVVKLTPPLCAAPKKEPEASKPITEVEVVNPDSPQEKPKPPVLLVEGVKGRLGQEIPIPVPEYDAPEPPDSDSDMSDSDSSSSEMTDTDDSDSDMDDSDSDDDMRDVEPQIVPEYDQKEFLFHGCFRGPESSFLETDPIVRVIRAGCVWSHNAGGAINTVKIRPRMMTLAANVAPSSDIDARFRNLGALLGYDSVLRDQMSKWSEEEVVEYTLNKTLIAFLLTGCIYSNGMLKCLPDVTALVPISYDCPPVTEEQRSRITSIAKIDPDLSRNIRIDVSSIRACPIVAADFTPYRPKVSTVNNLIACLDKRILAPELPVATDVLQQLRKLALDLAAYIKFQCADKVMPSVERLCEEAIASRPLKQRLQFMEGFRMYKEDYEETISDYCKQAYTANFKNELLAFNSGKPPRLVMCLKEKYRGVQVIAMCQVLWKIETGTQLCNVKHLTPNQVKCRLEEKFGDVGSVYESDYTSFESCETPTIKNVVENVVFEELAETGPTKEFIRRALKRKTVFVVGRGFTIPRCHHIRMSGDYWTSLGNLLTNIVVTAFITDRPVDYIIEHGLFEGDDGVFPVTGPAEDLERRALECGMRLKLSSAPWFQLSFCGQHFEDANGELVLTRDPQRVITQVCTLFDCNPGTAKDDIRLQRAKAISVLNGPWIRDASLWCAIIEKATRPFKVSDEFLLRHNLLREYSPFKPEACLPEKLKIENDLAWASYVVAKDHSVGGTASFAETLIMLNKARDVLKTGSPTPITTPFEHPLDPSPWVLQEGLRKRYFTHALSFIPMRVSPHRLPRPCLPWSKVTHKGVEVKAGYGPLVAAINKHKGKIMVAMALSVGLFLAYKYPTVRSIVKPISTLVNTVGRGLVKVARCVLPKSWLRGGEEKTRSEIYDTLRPVASQVNALLSQSSKQLKKLDKLSSYITSSSQRFADVIDSMTAACVTASANVCKDSKTGEAFPCDKIIEHISGSPVPIISDSSGPDIVKPATECVVTGLTEDHMSETTYDKIKDKVSSMISCCRSGCSQCKDIAAPVIAKASAAVSKNNLLRARQALLSFYQDMMLRGGGFLQQQGLPEKFNKLVSDLKSASLQASDVIVKVCKQSPKMAQDLCLTAKDRVVDPLAKSTKSTLIRWDDKFREWLARKLLSCLFYL